ncbi:nitrogen regulation protein NR(II) [Paenibacillus sp. FJAT-26967]|uniref:two-component system sensor histidine kinase NtrB n=1 Tax=Paenibacillus sp. FJAT-26967 TaxID=1729690 RepID=UPI00083990AA|nr:ATP-binding protein [Paenibacillus sp. FJAT-26967]
MPDIQSSYLQVLRDFVRSGSEDCRPYMDGLKPELHSLLPEDVITLHEKCMLRLLEDVNSTDADLYYKRSFLFLTEMVLLSRKREDVDRRDILIAHLKDKILNNANSFRTMSSKYENVLQHMDSGIALFDPEGFLSFANVKLGQFLGLPRKSMIGKTLYELIRMRKISKGMRRLLIKLHREMFLYRLPFQEVIDEKGQHFLVTAKYDEELDGDILISVKDVTDFKRIEQSAYYNDKLAMLGKIAASIAHEIRNPLTSIRGFIQLLQPELHKLGKQDYAEIILSEIDRANDIIFEFLNSSKPTAPVKEKVQISSLIKEIVLLFQSEAVLKGCDIQLGDSDPNLYVWVDVKQIKQVLLNLVKNAIEVISGVPGSYGLIRIRTMQVENQVWIYVEDNGAGMDQKTLSKLFDPFFTTKQDGTGLGLSVCYRIIKNHGGVIHVESEVGEGTSFRIQLPLN